jgi:hypothetical protein
MQSLTRDAAHGEVGDFRQQSSVRNSNSSSNSPQHHQQQQFAARFERLELAPLASDSSTGGFAI